jgi:photosystem II stability/assembly factor-like uncharacterized protein
MRLLTVILTWCLLAVGSVFAQGWQWVNPLPQGNGFSDLDYLGAGRVYCTGWSGASLFSADNGVTWSLRQTGAEASPSQTEFVGTTGWGITDSYAALPQATNSIFRTTDAGVNWDLIYQVDDVDLDDIDFVNANTGWVIGHTSDTYQLAILKTTDGGETWTQSLADSDGYHGVAFFLNEQQGWISLLHATLVTTDGGATWQRYTAPNWMYFDMYFTDGLNGWACAFDGVYHTTDGGANWNPSTFTLGPTEWPRSIAVVGTTELWVSTSTDDVNHRYDHLVHSTNSGATWTRVSTSSTDDLGKVVFADPEHGWACGENGVVHETNDGGITWNKRCGDRLGIGNGGYVRSVEFADRLNGWLTVYAGNGVSQVQHTTDGGLTWAVQLIDSVYGFASLSAISASNVWAVGSRLYHSTNGGASWDVVETGSEYGGMQVICQGEQVIWFAAGWEYPMAVYRSTDGGTSWTHHEVPLGLKFNGMAVAGATDVWVAGWADLDEGTVAHSSDGGVTWELQADSLGFLSGMYFVDPLNGWASTWGNIVRSRDGGDTWQAAGDSVWGTEHIQFLDTLNGWAVGQSAYRTTDGGVTWQEFKPYMGQGAWGLTVADPTHAWICGWQAVMMFDGSIFATPEPHATPPSAFVFLPAYPNPFNNTAVLRFDLPQAGRIRIELFEVTGRRVQTVVDRVFPAGSHAVPVGGDQLASGVYFARATAGSAHATQKLVLLK